MRILSFSLLEQPNVGDRFIVHKPKDVDEHPKWIQDMDMYDGAVIKIDRRSSYSNVWYANTVDFHDDNDDMYAVNASWLEKIDVLEDLEESTVDFLNIWK